MRRGHVLLNAKRPESTRINRILTPARAPAAAKFAMEPRHGTKVKENAEIKAEGRDVAAELTPGAFGKAFGRLQFHNDSPFHEHVNALEANLLTTESHNDRVLAIDPNPAPSKRDLECSRIERLDKTVSELVIDLKKASHNRVTQLLLDDGGTRTCRRLIRVIRVHSRNSGSAGRDRVTEIFYPAQICCEYLQT
jgi:hypothetical protein